MDVCKFQTFVVAVAVLFGVHCVESADTYTLDDSTGLGRVFDGIGGLSGGGATSRLLVSYPKEQRNQILDYLFKPNFAASLQILKVEIGGDAQSTDGTESSHMHTADDENYYRGYEWWLMTEAKKRNPNIKLYGLSWAYPAWVGNGSGSPYTYPETTAGYIVKWITGAKSVYNLTIDYIGIWNEKDYDATYIKTLRKALDDSSLSGVQIVAADGSFDKISANVLVDPDLNKATSILGAHYPGTVSDANAMKSGKKLWSSEDFSTFNDDVGAGCWARILNQNYVNGYMTSTISWNLIASYYEGLPYFRDGLMTAVEPWSGHYVDNGPIWISAHTTQFTQLGMHYLAHSSGVGLLNHGGSYVTFFDASNYDFTIVIETMSHDQSVCIRPPLPHYNVTSQTAVFKLMGNLATATTLNLWKSNVHDGDYFKQQDPIKIENGQFSIDLEVDCVYTLSTLTGQSHSGYQDIPESQMFPIPYQDNFDSYEPFSEASLFADQSGAFEITAAGSEVYMRQVVTTRPITWCNDANQPITIIGNISWVSMRTEVMVRLEKPDTLAFLAAGVSKGGCGISSANGIYVTVNSNNSMAVYEDLAMTKLLTMGKMEVALNTWYNIMFQIANNEVKLIIGGFGTRIPLPTSYTGGYIGFGTGGFYPAQFDNFAIHEASSEE